MVNILTSGILLYISRLNTGIIKIKFATASASSTRTLTEIGIITSSGNYIVFLQTHTNNNNAGSAYLIRYVNAVYLISPIIEGGNENAPRITLSGVLRLNTQTEQRTVSCGILGL